MRYVWSAEEFAPEASEANKEGNYPWERKIAAPGGSNKTIDEKLLGACLHRAELRTKAQSFA